MNPLEDVDVAGSKVVIKQGKAEVDFFDIDLATALRDYRQLKINIALVEPALRELKDQIIEKAKQHLNGRGTIRFVVDGKPVKVTFGYECVITEDNLAKVQELLGERFVDLVKIKTSYTGTQTLIDLASDADAKHPVRNYLTIKEKNPELKIED